MVLSVRLKAIHKGSPEVLRGGVAERPDIELQLHQLTTLGKNSVTMIADMGLKRNIVQLRLEPKHHHQHTNSIRIISVASGRVSVNGELVGSQALLEAGDIMSLHAPERAYDYQVVVDGDDEPEASPAKAGAQLKPNDAAAVTNLQHIAEEFTCAVCLDLQVQATTLVPCGHSFCKACVATAPVCSICSASIATTVSCRVLDNVICSLVSTNQVFSPDDAQVYQERMQGIATNDRSGTRAKNKMHTPKKRKSAAHTSGGSVVTGASVFDAISID